MPRCTWISRGWHVALRSTRCCCTPISSATCGSSTPRDVLLAGPVLRSGRSVRGVRPRPQRVPTPRSRRWPARVDDRRDSPLVRHPCTGEPTMTTEIRSVPIAGLDEEKRQIVGIAVPWNEVTTRIGYPESFDEARSPTVPRAPCTSTTAGSAPSCRSAVSSAARLRPDTGSPRTSPKHPAETRCSSSLARACSNTSRSGSSRSSTRCAARSSPAPKSCSARHPSSSVPHMRAQSSRA